MQASNDWDEVDGSFCGYGDSCIIYVCEHSDDMETCQICFEAKPSLKKKSKLQISGLVFLTPIYFLGILAYGVVAFFRFLAGGGLFGLMIVGWTISGFYHFFFVFIPFAYRYLISI